METIRDLMTTDVETCSLLDNVYEAAQKMKNLNVGMIPVVDQNQLVGVITDRDIVIRCIAEKQPPSSKVENIMTKNIKTVTPDQSPEDAAKIMAEYQVRRVPVVENNKLVGIVSLGDLAVHHLTDNHAKEALSEISKPERPNEYH